MITREDSELPADAIEASEFSGLVSRYDAIAVPTVVINDEVQLEGALPEDEFVSRILRTENGMGRVIAPHPGAEGEVQSYLSADFQHHLAERLVKYLLGDGFEEAASQLLS